MNRRRHTALWGWLALALVFSDTLVISHYAGKWEAAIMLLPTVAAAFLAMQAGIAKRYIP